MTPPNKDSLFGSKRQAPTDKANQLDSAVKEILASEHAIRERKTARLRELRLEKEALQSPPEPKTKSKRKAPKKSGTAETESDE
ncbi:hypothetical protein [Rhizobium sp. CCGE532]|uniref:hypothetical protein n=1 Tax=Rhizobium sp. CCGE532 TaxID=2364272 RepID=UPI000EA86844|nr:hypothetical protein [Rhizobium sp. CCGE532]AYG67158.1 hypothetical protein CCGE531_14910 [Rhizobium sp. CCGE531]AYG73534.1 hypothetical protein CCGE532_14325 [Rhizobium sp. CCGE532]